MKKPHVKLFGVGLVASIFTLVGFASPALSACIKKNPLFGFDVYMEDKYCPKLTPKKPKRKIARLKRTTAQKKPAKNTNRGKLPEANSQVRELQGLLAGLGYEPGPIDGVQGPATTRALGKFQDTMGVSISTSMANNLVLLHRLAGN